MFHSNNLKERLRILFKQHTTKLTLGRLFFPFLYMHIAIFGAGIGGLSACHELIKLGYTIDVYESKSIIGGMARSSSDDEGYPTEYSWRVYFGFYKNLFKIFDEINITNHLIKYKHKNFCDGTTLQDRINVFLGTMKGLTSCDERLEDMDNVSWANMVGDDGKYKNIFTEIGPALGLDRNKSSFYSVLRAAVEGWWWDGSQNYVLDGPTSEVWFDIWKDCT